MKLTAEQFIKKHFPTLENETISIPIIAIAEGYAKHCLEVEPVKNNGALGGVSGWLWLATTRPPLENKKYTVLDRYGNQEENVLFGCSGFMNEPYSFFEGKKVKAKDIIAYR